MYICICNAITDRQIGVGAGCGCCRDAAQQVIRDAACSGDCASCVRREAAAA